MAEDRYDDDDEHQPQRGVVFDLGANEVTEFSASPFASREVTPDGPMFAGAGDFAPMGAEFEAGKTMQYARMLGMDIVRDSEFVWIADEMARAELPPGWAEVAAKGGGIAFLDTSTQIVSDEHPTASYYRKLFERHKSESGRGDTPPQPSLEALEARLGAQKGGDGVAGDGAAGDGDGSGDSDSSLDSDDSDYEERLARRRARSRRRRSSGSSGGSTPDDDSDSDKENDASRRIRARERKAERKSVRQQIMEKAEQKSAAPVKRKTARDRVMDKAAEMSADAATQEATVREDRPAAGGAQQGAEELDAMDLNQRAAGRVKERHKRAPVAESDSDEDTVRLREEQKAAKAKREQKQKQRESLVTAKERRQIEKVALRREREAKKARKRQEEEEEEGQEQQEKARAAHKKEKFRRGMEEEYQSKTEEFRESYAKDHPVAVKKRKEKQTEEERRRREEEEAMRRAQETADLAAGEAERARLAKELRKEQPQVGHATWRVEEVEDYREKLDAARGSGNSLQLRSEGAGTRLLPVPVRMAHIGRSALLELFRLHPIVRPSVIDTIIDRLISRGPAACHWVGALDELVGAQPLAVLEHTPRLKQLLEYLLALPPATATAMLHSLLPLLRRSGSLREAAEPWYATRATARNRVRSRESVKQGCE